MCVYASVMQWVRVAGVSKNRDTLSKSECKIMGGRVGDETAE